MSARRKAGKIFSSMNLLHALAETDVSPSTLKLQIPCHPLHPAVSSSLQSNRQLPAATGCRQSDLILIRYIGSAAAVNGLPVKVSIQRKDRLQMLLVL